MKVIKAIGALVAFAVGVSSAWAAPTGSYEPKEWKASVALTNDVLRIDKVGDPLVVALTKGEAVNAKYGAYFNIFSGSKVTKFTAQGLPAGVKVDAKTYALTGKPTKKGISYAKITAANKNKFEFTRVIKFVVSDDDGEPDDPATEFADEIGLRDTPGSLFAGSVDGTPITAFVGGYGDWDLIDIRSEKNTEDKTSKTQTFTLSGLPTGLKLGLDKWSWKDGVESANGTEYGIYGAFTTPGRYVVKAKATEKEDSNKPDTYEAQFEFIVQGAESKYVQVKVGKGMEKFGKVGTKSTVVAAGKTLKLSATANKDYVFAGWYTDEDCTATLGYNWYMDDVLDKDGGDKIAAQTLINDGTLPDAIYARFIKKSADDKTFTLGSSLNGGLPGNLVGMTFGIDPNKYTVRDDSDEWELEMWVGTLGSYATISSLKGKGLPPCLAIEKWSGKFDEIWFNPAKKVVPGKYTLEGTAKNLSGVTTNFTFDIVISNLVATGVVNVNDEYDYMIDQQIADIEGILVDDEYKLTVSGLPAGLKFDAKEGKISGKPTKAGTFVVTFTAKKGKETVVATSTFNVLDPLYLYEAADYEYVGDCDLSDVLEIYSQASDIKDVKLSGLPKGVTFKFNAKEQTGRLTGVAQTAGRYVVTATVKNKSTTETIKFAIVVPNSDNVSVLIDGVPVSGVDSVARFIGGVEDTNKVIIAATTGYKLSVSGLPAGLTFNEKTGRIKGKSTAKAGTNDVVITATKGTTKETFSIKVWTYLPTVIVKAENLTWGTTNTTDKVTGAGAYAVGSTVQLTATVGKNTGSTFLGWYNEDHSTNYTTKATYSFKLTNETDVVLLAKFATKADDAITMVGSFPVYADNLVANLTNNVKTAVSKLKLSVSDLPDGLSFRTNVVSGTAKMPGIYKATVTAENASMKTNFVWELAVNNSDAFKAWAGAQPATLTNYYGFGISPLGTEIAAAYPTNQYKITVDGLPAGLKWDFLNPSNIVVTGAPSQAGRYTVTLKATSNTVSKASVVYLEVMALPDWFVGEFNGLSEEDIATAPGNDFADVADVVVAANGAATLRYSYVDEGKKAQETSKLVKNLSLENAIPYVSAAGILTNVVYLLDGGAAYQVTGVVSRVENYAGSYYGKAKFTVAAFSDELGTNFVDTVDVVRDMYSLAEAPTNLVAYAAVTNIDVKALAPSLSDGANLKLTFKGKGVVTARYTWKSGIEEVPGVAIVSPVVFAGAETGKVYALIYDSKADAEAFFEITVGKDGITSIVNKY